MTAVVLTELTDAEFAARRAGLVADAAHSFAAHRGLSSADAEAVAERETAAALPDGPRTPGQIVRQAVADGEVVGWIWISLPGTKLPSLAWVSDVVVDEPYRSRGLGRAIMEAGERELTARGLDRVGLNVYHGNDHALRLYRGLGYEVIREQRSRALTGLPGTLSSPVDLVPMKPAEFERRRAGLIRREATHRERWQSETPAGALLAATAVVDGALPYGLHTGGALLFTALVDGAEVGWIWAAVPGPARPGTAWLHDVEVDAAYRRRGHARAMAGRVEAQLVREGVRSIGAHVPGDGVAARRLADALGLRVVSQQMVKNLS